MKKMKRISMIVGIVSLCVMFSTTASALTISDGFSGATVDTNKWVIGGGGSGYVAVEGGALHIVGDSGGYRFATTTHAFGPDFTIAFDFYQPSTEANNVRRVNWGDDLWVMDIGADLLLYAKVDGKYPWSGGAGFAVPYGYGGFKYDTWYRAVIVTEPGKVTGTFLEIGTTTQVTVTYNIDIPATDAPVSFISFSGTGVSGMLIDNVVITFVGTIADELSALQASIDDILKRVESLEANGAGLSANEVQGMIDASLTPVANDVNTIIRGYNAHTHDKGSGGRNTSVPVPQIVE